ncbi:hypothetical protein [Halostagnicola sp. A-GB9-2]|uniref:hypothetical protein n=1 Tax=Halostagnicola sp. A-GB9-2 TaxID=3048066 RepID=UPI0024BF6B7D|nr:hypothetical protein [Halostagnicola sp. A-GB9-2]MDJ1431010.1 hypothetical protein [Halostagnicola sp. A-GB9-2]
MTEERDGWSDIYRLPQFFDRLEDQQAVSIKEAVDELEIDLEMDIEGIVYHDRGIRVPGYDAMFIQESEETRSVPAFSVEVGAVGPRSAWGVFDASKEWDAYLLTADDVAAIAWVSDDEFTFEESKQFTSKDTAIGAGRFSFGVFLYESTEWNSLVEELEQTDSPAYLHHDDGSTYYPQTQPEFYRYVDSSPEEFRESGGGAPGYLGLLELEVTIDD